MKSTKKVLQHKSTKPRSMGHVLVLNGDFTPATIISVERALVLIYQEKVVLVEDDENKRIHSAYADFLFPSVVRLAEFVRLPFKKVPLTKRNVQRRDNYECAYCLSGKNLTVDHIMPKSRGGEDSWVNWITCCKKCNNLKNNKTPEESGMPLLKKAHRPNHIMFLKSMGKETSKKWEAYLYA